MQREHRRFESEHSQTVALRVILPAKISATTTLAFSWTSSIVAVASICAFVRKSAMTEVVKS